MTTEIVCSKQQHEGDLKDSPIWDECYHEEDVPWNDGYFKHYIKFDGLKPVQLTKSKRQ